jgi:hypothetical protein
MASYALKAAFVLIFLTVCVGQVAMSHDTNTAAGLWLIHRILLAGHTSGSLAYSGCGFDKRVPPDLPRLGFLDESGPPKEILRKLFDADPVMQVTQEGGA